MRPYRVYQIADGSSRSVHARNVYTRYAEDGFRSPLRLQLDHGPAVRLALFPLPPDLIELLMQVVYHSPGLHEVSYRA